MTGPVAALDKETVKARSFAPLLPSLTVASATARVGSGAVSSLVMVPIAVPSAMVAPLGDDSVRVSVSLASTAVSPDTCTLTTFEVSPAAKVTVPVAAV